LEELESSPDAVLHDGEDSDADEDDNGQAEV
jgi:hypothetical protein